MRKLDWVFSIIDRVSAPVGKATQALWRMLDIVGKVGRAMEMASTIATGFASSLGIIGDIAGRIEDLGRTAIDTARSVGTFIVSIASERESALTALQTALGSLPEAQTVFQQSLLAAQRTPFDTADVIRDRMQLVLGGFSREESRVLYAAAADVGAALGPDRMQTLMHAMTRIGASGQLSGRVLEEIDASGVGRMNLFRTLAQQMGRRELLTNQRALAAWAGPMIERMQSGQALGLLISSIRGRFSGGGIIGQGAVNLSQTLGGVLSNLRSLPHDLLIGMDFEHMPGLQGFKRSLMDIMDLFDGNAKTGRDFREVLGQIINTLFSGLFGRGQSQSAGFRLIFDRLLIGMRAFNHWLLITVPRVREFVGSFFTGGGFSSVLTALGAIGGGFVSFFQGFMRGMSPFLHTMSRLLGLTDNAQDSGRSMQAFGATLGQVFGAVATGATGVVVALMNVWGWIAGAFNIGSGLVHGIEAGISSAWNGLFDTVGNLATGVVDRMRNLLGIHSPSTVFAEMGRMSAAGFQEGLGGMAGTGIRIDGAQSAIRFRFDIDVRNHGSGDSQGAREAAGEIADQVDARIRDFFRRADLASVTQ